VEVQRVYRDERKESINQPAFTTTREREELREGERQYLKKKAREEDTRERRCGKRLSLMRKGDST